MPQHERQRRAGYRFGYYVLGPMVCVALILIVAGLAIMAFGGLL